jgi:hypothetical protein
VETPDEAVAKAKQEADRKANVWPPRLLATP